VLKNKQMKKIFYVLGFLLISFYSYGQQSAIQKHGNLVPAVYSGIMPNDNGDLYFVSVKTGDTAWMSNKDTFYTLYNLRIEPAGSDIGLFFNFNNKEFYGTLYYGLFAKNSLK